MVTITQHAAEDLIMKRHNANNAKSTLLAAGAALGLILLSGAKDAKAGDWGFHIGLGTAHVAPLHAAHVRVVEPAPAYRLVTRRIWVEPVYEERTIRVEVPPVVRERVVPTYDYYGRLSGYRTIREVLEPGRVEYRTERVLVREGYFKTVTVRVPVKRVARKVVRVGYADAGFGFGLSYRSHGGQRHHRHYRRHVPVHLPHRPRLGLVRVGHHR